MTETAGPTIRIAVQSSRRLMRDAVAAYLGGRPGFTVVGQTAGVADLYPLCSLRRPDVIVADAGPLTVELVEALRALRAAFPAVDVVVAYAELTPEALRAAIRAGLTALVPCAQGLEALVRVVRQRANPTGRAAPDGLALTDRELEIIQLLAVGHSVPEMAALLEISPHTVENHKRHLYAKLDVGTQSHAVSRAASLGLTRPTLDAALRTAAGDGRDPLVVLAGPPGRGLDEVAQALVACGVAVTQQRRPGNGGPGYEHPAEWYPGPVTAVLVDPRPGDWAVPVGLGVPAVVVHTTVPTLATVVDALLRGAHALLHRDQVRADLAPVLSLVRRGYVAMSVDRFAELATWTTGGLTGHGSGLPELTARERDILASIADGHTVRQTARALGIAAKTVENTQARLFRKLGVRNRSGALTAAYRLGLIDPAVAGHPTP
jgi:DNA-binding NarL/FixJ family response regulator